MLTSSKIRSGSRVRALRRASEPSLASPQISQVVSDDSSVITPRRTIALSSAMRMRKTTASVVLFLGFLQPVYYQGQAGRVLYRRLHHEEAIAIGTHFEQARANGLGGKQNLRLAQFYAVAVRRDFHRRDARMVVGVENFFSIAAPGWSETVAYEKPATRLGKSHDVDLTVPGFIGRIGNPFCVWRKHWKASVVFFLEKRIRLAVAKHGQYPHVEVAAVQDFVRKVFSVRGPTAGVLIRIVVIQQFLLASAISGSGVEINLASAAGVEDNRVSIRRPDGIVIPRLRETELRLGSADHVVDVNFQMSSRVGSRCRDSLSVGRDMYVLERSRIDDITFFAAAVVPGEIEACGLSAGEHQLAVVRK